MAGALQLIIACAGIFGSFSYFAVLQEDVYKTDYDGEKFQFTFLALLVERGINALVAAVGVAAFGGSGLKIPYMDISLSGMSQMFAMAGSNEALRYVSYPTQVLGKSCKMVPVMAGGIVLGGKRYSFAEYLQAPPTAGPARGYAPPLTLIRPSAGCAHHARRLGLQLWRQEEEGGQARPAVR